MSVYVKCYRCLVCKELYSSRSRVTCENSNDAENVLFNEAIGGPSVTSETHYCDDGNIGLALLAGFVRKLSEDDE